tara:strand:- start:13574 stop:16222 length:2649 start_codon:yes stop_codon:yes gene_type:complete
MALRAPGVQFTEKAGGAARADASAAASMAAFVGATLKGPVGVPTLVSYKEFVRQFGGFIADGLMPLAAYIYLTAGANQAWVVRTVAADSVESSVDLSSAVTGEDTGLDGDGSETNFAPTLDDAPIVPGTLSVRHVATAAARALTCVAKASLVDGETVTIGDGVTSVIFEFDLPPDGVGGGNTVVDVSADTTDAEVAARLGAAIDASALDISVASYAVGVINLVHDTAGAAGTITIADTVVNAGFAAGALTDGVDAATVTDNSDGALTGDGSGTIDYATGEIVVDFDAAPGVTDILADYQTLHFGFEMQWEGVAGNDFDIRLSGNGGYYDYDTASWSRFDLDVVEVTADGEVVHETFEALVLDDIEDGNFLASVINDPVDGSAIITATTGAAGIPSALVGVQVLAEAVAMTPAFDGSQKSFTGSLANTPAATTLALTFSFTVSDEVIGAAGSTAYSGTLNRRSAKAGTLVITDGVKTATDDGAGSFTGDVDPGGTINYATGAYSVTFNGLTVGAVTADYTEGDVVVDDDGDGGLVVDVAASSGVNRLSASSASSHDDEDLTVVWRDAPEAGTVTAAYYTQPSSLVDMAMASGSDGTAVGRSDVTGATAAANTTGIYALTTEPSFSFNLCIPDFETDPMAIQEVTAFIENQGDKRMFFPFGIPDSLSGSVNRTRSWFSRTLGMTSEFTAAYAPHIRTKNPLTSRTIAMPPGVYVCAALARAHATSDAAETPAGMDYGQVYPSIGLTADYNEPDVALLRSSSINAIIQWRETGRVIWGGLLTKQTSKMSYVNQRQTFMRIRQILRSNAFAFTFKRVAQASARAKIYAENVLLGEWRAGLLRGASASEAFFVDVTNPAPNETKVEIGLATHTPNEFTTFELSSIEA